MSGNMQESEHAREKTSPWQSTNPKGVCLDGCLYTCTSIGNLFCDDTALLQAEIQATCNKIATEQKIKVTYIGTFETTFSDQKRYATKTKIQPFSSRLPSATTTWKVKCNEPPTSCLLCLKGVPMQSSSSPLDVIYMLALHFSTFFFYPLLMPCSIMVSFLS